MYFTKCSVSSKSLIVTVKPPFMKPDLTNPNKMYESDGTSCDFPTIFLTWKGKTMRPSAGKHF